MHVEEHRPDAPEDRPYAVVSRRGRVLSWHPDYQSAIKSITSKRDRAAVAREGAKQ